MPRIKLGRIEPGTGEISFLYEEDPIPLFPDVPRSSNTVVLRGDVNGAGAGNIETFLSASGVMAGTYTLATVVVDAAGRVVMAASGEVSGGGGGGLSSVTAGSGLSGGTITSVGTIALTPSGVTLGTYTLSTVTVDSFGRVTAAANGAAVTSVTAGNGLTGGTITSVGTIALDTSGVTLGTYTLTTVTVDSFGRVTSAASGSAVTGVVAGDGLTGGTITSTGTIALEDSGVVPGTYTNTTVVVDAKGRVTGISDGVSNADPIVFVVYANGSIAAAETLAYFQIREPITFDLNFPDCGAISQAATTAETIFSIQKNGTQVGSIVFGIAATAGTYGSPDGVSYVEGDTFSLVAPDPADDTLANVGFTFRTTEITE